MIEVSQAGNISDVHLTINRAPTVRVDGVLKPYLQRELTAHDLVKIKKTLLNKEQRKRLEEQGELDFPYTIPQVCRFRVNAYYQKGNLAFALRNIPYQVMPIDELGLPAVIKDLSREGSGLILLSGPTGSGKSTTLSAVLEFINTDRACHIITLEDPIEYLHRHKKSIVHQREMGADTRELATALRVTLRQDPDIILVGEMRDLESIQLALEAAETGHLVFGTLHTRNAPQSIDRILDVFPSEKQPQIRIQLSMVLEAVVAQKLIPRNGGGRVAIFELMMATSAVRNLIREGKTYQLHSMMQLHVQEGMQTFDDDLVRLLKEDRIQLDAALRWSWDQEYLEKSIQREGLFDLSSEEEEMEAGKQEQ